MKTLFSLALVLSHSMAFGGELKIGMTLSAVTNLLGTPSITHRTVTKDKSDDVLGFEGGTACRFENGKLESFTITTMPLLESALKALVRTNRESMTVAETNSAAPSNSPAALQRPRTIAEAKAQRAMLTGERLKQAGGSPRGSSSVNAIVTGFSEYDAEFIAAVQQRWYALLDRHNGKMQSGKVVLEFRLHSDGRVSNMKVSESGVSDALSKICQSSILDPTPYRPWPGDIRREIGANYRDVRLSFYYN